MKRSLAEIENQRRRFEKEIKDAFEFGSFNFAKESLAILDNLERAKNFYDELFCDLHVKSFKPNERSIFWTIPGDDTMFAVFVPSAVPPSCKLLCPNFLMLVFNCALPFVTIVFPPDSGGNSNPVTFPLIVILLPSTESIVAELITCPLLL